MRLEASQSVELIHYSLSAFVVPWRVNVWADVHEPEVGKPESFVVGRILADTLSRFDIEECGEDAWTVADEDSAGLELAWASLLDENGHFREDEFESIADPVVYTYRFALHPDFAEWRMPVMDAFCRLFGTCGLVLAQHNTTVYSLTEFETLGFRPLIPKGRLTPGTSNEPRFMVRDNACARYSMASYPEESPNPGRQHKEWLEAQGP
jgi:hypothetical protein